MTNMQKTPVFVLTGGISPFFVEKGGICPFFPLFLEEGLRYLNRPSFSDNKKRYESGNLSIDFFIM